MKLSELKPRQQKAFLNIKYAATWLIGSLENTLLDNDEDSTEYAAAKAELVNHDELVKTIYQMATNEVYQEGACRFSESDAKYLKDVRFCGKAWLLERVEARVHSFGY